MMKNKIIIIKLLLLTAFKMLIFSQTIPITNGSMNGPTAAGITPSGWTATNGYTPNGITAVSATPDILSTSFTAWANNAAVAVSASPNGGTWVALSSIPTPTISTAENEAIKQTITGLTIGHQYSFTMYVANFGGGSFTAPGKVSVWINGTKVGESPTLPLQANVWTTMNVSFTAITTSAEFLIDALHEASQGGYYSIDGISNFTDNGVVSCYAGTTAPQLNGTSISNTSSCPATTTTVNLNSIYSGITPLGSSLVWFTNNTHSGTAYATPTAAIAGTYYAFYYDAVNNCYSPASNAVTVTINSCPAVCSGTGVPATGSNTYNGVTVTPSLSGNATTYATAFTDCGITTNIGAAWLNNNTSTANTGTVTYTFSKPVNNVVVRFNATSFISSAAEVVTITTNNGTVTTTAAALCGVTKSGNTFTATGANGGAEVTVTSTLPYTSLTVNDVGNNQNNGTVVELCSTSVVPYTIPCNSGNTAPGIQ